MGWQKFLPSLKFRNLILCPTAVIFFQLLPQMPLQAAPKLPPTVDRGPFDGSTPGGGTRWRDIKFPPTENPGAVPSARTSGGGTRRRLSSCTQQNKAPLTALMPRNNVGTTFAANPTFFLYVPKTTARAPNVEFSLVDEQENEVYETRLSLTGTPGIINLSLPASKSLKVGTTYHWQFTLICDPQDPQNEEFEFVEGSIKRTEMSPSLKTKIAQAAPLEQAKLYADAGVWHEALTIIAQMRSSRPSEWEGFLQSVELDAIAQVPFVEYVYINEPTEANAAF